MRKAGSWLGLGLLVGSWCLLTLVTDPRIVPWPWDVGLEFIRSFPMVLLPHLVASLLRVTAAMGLSLLLAVPLGIMLGVQPQADAIFSPLAYFLFPIPKVALLPILMILLGLGESSKLLLMILILFFQILISARDAVKGIERPYLYSMAILRPSPLAMLRYLYLPYALPKILAALRVGTGTALAVLFFAENYGTQHGIGYYIMDRWMRFRYTEMYSGIMALSLLGLGLFALIDGLERWLCPWLGAAQVDTKGRQN